MESSRPSFAGTLLVSLGGACTVVGGLGVGFRAAGLGYLGQSLLALVLGVTMLWAGLRLAASSRRLMLATVRTTPIRVAAAYQQVPEQPRPRVRVQAWTAAPLELGPARAA